MPEPCRGCERKHVDFGGCRCQAALLTGDAANTDPACELSPHRRSLTQIVDRVSQPSSAGPETPPADAERFTPTYRTNPY